MPFEFAEVAGERDVGFCAEVLIGEEEDEVLGQQLSDACGEPSIAVLEFKSSYFCTQGTRQSVDFEVRHDRNDARSRAEAEVPRATTAARL